MKPRPVLGLFEVTNLVIGAVIGADIYVVASLGAADLGPAVLVVWIVDGVLAAIIALAFVQSAVIVPRAGGSYAYVNQAFGQFPAFLVGWALYVGEWMSLAVFPIAFVRYLGFFVPDIPLWASILIKTAFVAFITGSNVVGTRTGGIVNDILTLAKLTPLLILVLTGLLAVAIAPTLATNNLTPFAPMGWQRFGPALIVVFWAYAGFELATLPAEEIVEPRRTLPRAFLWGMAVVTVFYLLVNFVVVASLPTAAIATSEVPLVTSANAVLQVLGLPGALGASLMAFGALLSISGVDESISLGASRLLYAMAVDGFLPHSFARLHPRFGTPYLGLLFQGGTSLAAAIFGDLTGLITISVFSLSIAYIATGLAAARLVRLDPSRQLRMPAARALPLASVAAALFLSSQAGLDGFIRGTALILAGVPVYFFFAPKIPLGGQRDLWVSSARRLSEVGRTSRVFLAGFVQLVGRALRLAHGDVDSKDS